MDGAATKHIHGAVLHYIQEQLCLAFIQSSDNLKKYVRCITLILSLH
jgi:hypothetical protein